MPVFIHEMRSPDVDMSTKFLFYLPKQFFERFEFPGIELYFGGPFPVKLHTENIN